MSFLRDKGKPRYLHGKLMISQGSRFCTTAMLSSEHWIGITLLFCTLVLSPEASPKSCKIFRIKLISFAAVNIICSRFEEKGHIICVKRYPVLNWPSRKGL